MDKKLEDECSKLRKELQKEKGKNRMLKAEVSKLKEDIKEIKKGKSRGRVEELREQLAGQEEANRNLNGIIYIIEQEKKQMLQSKGMVSQLEYEGLLKQLERERQAKEQYQRLYEQEKDRRNELKESFKTQNKNKDMVYPRSEEKEKLVARIKELEAKLSRKGTGKPRNNNTTDNDVFALRNDGRTIREICRITGMSTATVVKILKGVNNQ